VHPWLPPPPPSPRPPPPAGHTLPSDTTTTTTTTTNTPTITLVHPLTLVPPAAAMTNTPRSQRCASSSPEQKISPAETG
jgi:hypothetical protein